MSIREENELFLFAEELQRCMSPAVLKQLIYGGKDND